VAAGTRTRIMKACYRKGWTMLEVCVVIVLVALGLLLLFPGIQYLRVASRRSQCQSRMADIGIAMQNYHQDHGLLPPAVLRPDINDHFDLATLNSHRDPHRQYRSYANWAVMLLPYRGEQELADALDQSAPVMDAANAGPRSADLAILKCPADPYNNAENAYQMTSEDGTVDAAFARGNYGLNCGTSGLDNSPGKPWRIAPGGAAVKTVRIGNQIVHQQWGNGVGGVNKSYSVQDFQNGLSNLVGVDELRAGVVPGDARGVWALGDTGSSMTWRHGLLGDAGGPNCPRHRADDTIGCNQAHKALGVEGLAAEGMTCCSYAEAAVQATARSAHPGGVNALMMDGSVRFITDDIDQSIWHAIHSNETREIEVPESCDPPDVASRKIPPAPSPKHEPEGEARPTITNSIGMRLVLLPAGEFIMGLADEGEDTNDPITGVQSDVPPHKVRLTKDFHFSAFEVTQGQYEYVMGENPSWHSKGGGGEGQVYQQDTSNYPIENVAWTDAVKFCCCLSELPDEKAAGRRYRLPTEAEWEYACRAGSTVPFSPPRSREPIIGWEFNAFYYSDEPTGYNVFFYRDEGFPLAKVGSYLPNPWGIYDMRGNAWEWCQDWFGWDYYLHSPIDDPQGPDHGVFRTIRYADWRFTGHACKHTKVQCEPWVTNGYVGFRVVCEGE
jgi:prepilin-type processing-associated H-X9-DG protein